MPNGSRTWIFDRELHLRKRCKKVQQGKKFEWIVPWPVYEREGPKETEDAWGSDPVAQQAARPNKTHRGKVRNV